ncbi:hypothetical protein [Streptomyces anthocyanicus]|uniref:hypothetical protein n=1 Tax=Streptomyces anthocyanicus TaxID=68174 RepID=UPI00386566DB|nr:hypothetical protein OH747_05550 [Streptomyces anthocyanicus]
MSLALPISPDHLLATPLPQLLAETCAEVIDAGIPDSGFFGAVVQHKNGDVLLAMPSDRSELEHDTMARYLLAQVFGVDLPKLAVPFVTTEL